jgi:hypothetical protein
LLRELLDKLARDVLIIDLAARIGPEGLAPIELALSVK